jgi:hypothetical protein
MTKPSILRKLEVVDRRSIGRSSEVVTEVLANPELFGGSSPRCELLWWEMGEHFPDDISDTLVPFFGGQPGINLSGRSAPPDQCF